MRAVTEKHVNFFLALGGVSLIIKVKAFIYLLLLEFIVNNIWTNVDMGTHAIRFESCKIFRF